MTPDARGSVRTTYRRTCMFCGRPAKVLLPEGADDLDVVSHLS